MHTECHCNLQNVKRRILWFPISTYKLVHWPSCDKESQQALAGLCFTVPLTVILPMNSTETKHLPHAAVALICFQNITPCITLIINLQWHKTLNRYHSKVCKIYSCYCPVYLPVLKCQNNLLRVHLWASTLTSLKYTYSCKLVYWHFGNWRNSTIAFSSHIFIKKNIGQWHQ